MTRPDLSLRGEHMPRIPPKNGVSFFFFFFFKRLVLNLYCAALRFYGANFSASAAEAAAMAAQPRRW